MELDQQVSIGIFVSDLTTDQLFCVREGLVMSMIHNNEYLIWEKEFIYASSTVSFVLSHGYILLRTEYQLFGLKH